MKNKKYIFFDLDHTLWDTDRNSEESLSELFHKYELLNLGVPSFQEFYSTYQQHNERLWGLYAENQIGKDAVRYHRFHLTFQDFGLHDQVTSEKLADDFMSITPHKPHLIEGAKELLEKLKSSYTLAIITNGFKESQHKKLKSSNIEHYFEKEHIFISEELGFHKPDPTIYYHAMKVIGTTNKDECLMIGDTLSSDIMGALNAGWQAIHLSPEGIQHKEPVITVKSLKEIEELF